MLTLNVIQFMVFIVVLTVQVSTCLLRYPLTLLRDSLEINLLFSPSDCYFLENSLKVSIAFSQIYFSSYADQRLPRRLIAVSLMVSGGVMILIGKFEHYDVMLILIIISGVFQGLVWPSLCKCLFFWIQESRLNTYFGLLSLADYFGSMLANFLAVFLLKKYPWNFVYPLLSTVVVITSVFAFFSLYLPQELKIEVPGRISYKKLSQQSSFSEKWALPGVSDLSFAVCFLRLVKSAMVSWLPEFFIQRVGFSEYRTELALMIYKIGNLFGCIGFGFTARKETVLLQSLVLLAIGTVGLVLLWVTLSWGFLWSVHLLAIAGFAIGGPTGALSASFPVSLGELDSRKSGGTLVGIINGFGNIGELFEQTIFSFVIETYGWNSMFILLINLLVFSAFLVNRAHFATNNKLVNSRQYNI